MNKNIIIIIALISSIILSQGKTFAKNKNTVSDSSTLLQWQDNSDANTTKKKWTEAIDYCEGIAIDTYTDWRLPNKNELLSIIDYDSNSSSFPFKENEFNNTISSAHYWTSTTFSINVNEAWAISFEDGSTIGADKQQENYIRCVRRGK